MNTDICFSCQCFEKLLHLHHVFGCVKFCVCVCVFSFCIQCCSLFSLSHLPLTVFCHSRGGACIDYVARSWKLNHMLKHYSFVFFSDREADFIFMEIIDLIMGNVVWHVWNVKRSRCLPIRLMRLIDFRKVQLLTLNKDFDRKPFYFIICTNCLVGFNRIQM